jgi:hypothetical protein
LHDWDMDLGAAPGDLHFSAGTIIIILSDLPGHGWSTGRLHEKVGVYPTTYVEELSPPPVLTATERLQQQRQPPPPPQPHSSRPSLGGAGDGSEGGAQRAAQPQQRGWRDGTATEEEEEEDEEKEKASPFSLPTMDLSFHSLKAAQTTWQPMLSRLDSAIMQSESVLAKSAAGRLHQADRNRASSAPGAAVSPEASSIAAAAVAAAAAAAAQKPSDLDYSLRP